MMIILFWALLVLLALVVQAVLLPLFAYKGVFPDLLLMITVSAGLLFGREYGVGMGFFAGLLQDLASGGIFGINTLPKLLIGLAAGSLERKVFKEHILLPLAAIAVTSVVQYGLMLGLLAFFGFRVDFAAAVAHNLLPLVIYNLIFSVPMHWIVHKTGRLHY